MSESLILSPTADPQIFLSADGARLSPSQGWECLPPGDAGLTRRVKAAGPSWKVVEKRGRNVFSRGLWAPAAHIAAARAKYGRREVLRGEVNEGKGVRFDPAL